MVRLRIPVAGVPGAWSSEALAAALREEGAESFVFPVEECSHDLGTDNVRWGDLPLGNVDGVAVKKLGDAASPHARQRVEVLYALRNRGAVVVSGAEAIDAAVDRYHMSALLARAEVPMPRTQVTESFDEAEGTVERWGEVVAKPLFTSKGRGMTLMTEERANRITLRTWGKEGRGPYYLQRFVPARGRDVAVAMLGGRVLGAYSRVAAPDQWQTTTRMGGHYEPAEVTDEMAEIATRALDIFGLDYTTVDMVHTPRGWLVYEVSAFGGFTGLRKALGLEVAPLFAKHVIAKVRHERA